LSILLPSRFDLSVEHGGNIKRFFDISLTLTL
jgi:hypothetical protein